MRNSNTTGFLFSSPPTNTYPGKLRLAITDAVSYMHEQQPGRFSRPEIRIHPAGKCSRIGAGVKEGRGGSAPQLTHSSDERVPNVQVPQMILRAEGGDKTGD